MQLTIDLPDEVAQRLMMNHKDLSRQALEALAIEGYRCHMLTHADVMALLGFENRFEVDALFKAAGLSTYTWDDLEEDREAFRMLSSR